MSRLKFKEHSHREFYYTDENQKSTSDFLHTGFENNIKRSDAIIHELSLPSDKIVHTGNYKASNWLSQFLSKKRVDDLCLVPDMMPMQDSYIKEFHERFSKVSSSDDENDYTNEQQAVGEINIGVKYEDESTLLASVTLFNLPYTAAADEVITFGKKYGFTFSNVLMNIDKKTNLPSGSALCDISDIDKGSDQEIDIPGSFSRLQGQLLGGRPIRVSYAGEKRRNSSGRDNSRYFGVDISRKCSLCGIVGHKQNDCTNEPIPFPCHLCAGKDHEAVGCPNITCYRCGRFGHHSKDCSGYAYSKSSICVQCGSTSHDIRFCLEQSTLDNPRIQGRGIRCMICSNFGHCLCLKIFTKSKSGGGDWRDDEEIDIYCPNCGKKGHHVDFSITGDESQCQCPKYEAFMKYPNLLRDLDYCDSDGERRQLCMNALRGGGRDMQLFPFLLPPKRPLNRSSSYPQPSTSSHGSWQSSSAAVQRSSSVPDWDEPHYSQRGRTVTMNSEDHYRKNGPSNNNSSWRMAPPPLPYQPPQPPHHESSRYDRRGDDGESKSRGDRERFRGGRSLYEGNGRRVFCEDEDRSSSDYGNEQHVSSKNSSISSKSNYSSSRKRGREVAVEEDVSDSRNHRKKYSRE